MPSFDSRGFSLHYEVLGEGDRTPLLLIMGMGGTCRGWTVVTTPYHVRERPCVIFDNRGAGRSADPGTPFTTRDMAADTLAVMDELGLERVHVLGGFLGGLVAQELALAVPERVGCLVLVGTYAKADAKLRAVIDLWRTMAEIGMSEELRVRNRLAWTLSDVTMEQEDIVDAMWRFYLEDDVFMEDKVFARQADACLEHDTSDRLGEILSPTLVVCGENDILTPARMHRALRRGIPNSRLVVFPGAGHLVTAELAPRFNRLVGRFLAERE